MYRSFSIKNFRCFDELTVEGMGRINLIAGKNNVGKTALLEALWVHSWPINPDRALHLDTARGILPADSNSVFDNLFLHFNGDSLIELCARGDWGNEARRLEISTQEIQRVQHPLIDNGDNQMDSQSFASPRQLVMSYFDETNKETTSKGWVEERVDQPSRRTIIADVVPPTPAQRATFLFADTRSSIRRDSGLYSRLEIKGEQNGILEILQEIEPRLSRLAVVSTEQAPSIYADISLGRLIPIQLMGAGMSHILSLALAIASNPGGIVLVDEIESGIHYTVMEKVWRAIGAFARSYDVQLFATTHSHHCIQSACIAFEADENDGLRLFRIQRSNDGKYRAVKYDRERLKAAFGFGFGVI